MRRNKYLLLIALFVAILILSASFLIEYIFVYSRWSFWQFFLAGFAIIGCGFMALFFFMMYSAHRKLLLDKLNVFVVNFLLYLKDFRDNLQSHESFDDSLERLKNIKSEKDDLLSAKKGFFIKGAYTSVINAYSGYIDEYVEIHNKIVPQILKTKIPAERERMIGIAMRMVDDLSFRGYMTAKKYARRRGGSYKFNDFKAIVDGEKYEQMYAEKNSKPKKVKQSKNPHPHGQQYQPQRPAGTPPPQQPQRPAGNPPPPKWQPQRPAGTPPPQQPQRPAGTPPPQQPQRPAGTPPPQQPQRPAGTPPPYQPQRPTAAPPPQQPVERK